MNDTATRPRLQPLTKARMLARLDALIAEHDAALRAVDPETPFTARNRAHAGRETLLGLRQHVATLYADCVHGVEHLRAENARMAEDLAAVAAADPGAIDVDRLRALVRKYELRFREADEANQALRAKLSVAEQRADAAEAQVERVRVIVDRYAGLAVTHPHISGWIADIRAALADSEEPTYPCAKCGKPRTREQGGTLFTVCDECWEIRAVLADSEEKR